MSGSASATETPEHRLLLDVLNSLGTALGFFNSEGVPLHGTRRLGILLAQQPDGAMLQRELQHFVQELSGILKTRPPRGHPGVEAVSDRRVAGAGGVYRMRGSYVGAYLFNVPGTILVAVECPATDPLAAEVLREGWQLSERQAAVAQLLARGRTNEEIAAALTISPHTARRHTEQIMLKLGARTRTEAASLLLRS